MKKIIMATMMMLAAGTASAQWYGDWYSSEKYKNIALTQDANKNGMSIKKMHFQLSPGAKMKDQLIVGLILKPNTEVAANYVNGNMVMGNLKFGDGKRYMLMSSMSAPFHDFSDGKFNVQFLVMPSKKGAHDTADYAEIRREFVKNKTVQFAVFDKNMTPHFFHFSLRGSSKALAAAGL